MWMVRGQVVDGYAAATLLQILCHGRRDRAFVEGVRSLIGKYPQGCSEIAKVEKLFRFCWRATGQINRGTGREPRQFSSLQADL